jgi:hypothetical protein
VLRPFVLLLSGLSIASCETYSEVAAKPPEGRVEISRNYQAVYAGLLGRMRDCGVGGDGGSILPSGIYLDAQLYPDLGYGEIVSGLAGTITATFTRTVVRRQGASAVVEVTTGSQAPWAREHSVAWTMYWARGGTTCPSLGFGSPPPI